ncbi:hypothetical protein HYU23_03345 [Candidatus Woesearchaeota archaeon]|nr:hypothetical protein [Candidatus Woesearchaeota archaeon]
MKETLRKIWYFIWKDDSLLSWIVNIILAFLLVKFIIYPGLGLLFGTSYPVVAVVSGSMEHNGYDFNNWWKLNGELYEKLNISKEEFSDYRFSNGFNKGDLMVIFGSDEIERGDVIVFFGLRSEPIIHRVVVAEDRNGNFYIQTKGDNNIGSRSDELGITNDRLVGVAKLRIPYLGWFKLGFLKLIGRI